MKNYDEMSDFEINKAVAGIIYPQLKLLSHNDGRSVFVSKSEDKLDFMAIKNSNFNPCSDPSDAWPIIESIWEMLNSIHTVDMLGLTGVTTTLWCYYMAEYNCGALRAAMICFLKMMDAK